jgi:hypothetical protein
MQITEPAGGITNPNQLGLAARQGPIISAGRGSVLLLIQAGFSLAGSHSFTEGVDYYLVDSAGEKKRGYFRHPLLGWLNDPGGSLRGSGTLSFLYPIREDRVAGAVFHLFGKEFAVPSTLSRS